jgi:hypothetical protein
MYYYSIYAALALGFLGLASRSWRLHGSMVVLSSLTLWAVAYLQAYMFPNGNDMLVAAFFDAAFGGMLAAVLFYTEYPSGDEKRKRRCIYYGIISSLFLLTSMLNVAAWIMNLYGDYSGSWLSNNFVDIIFYTNIIQMACLVEGGKDGLNSIIAYLYRGAMRLYWFCYHKTHINQKH